MKRTKSMIYNPSAEARELYLYAINNESIYSNLIQNAIKNLRKKAIKGIYDSQKAIDLFYHIATMSSDKYFKEFGYKFSVQNRFTCAVDLEACFIDDVFEGIRE